MPRLHKNKLPTIGENTNYKGSRGDGPLREIFSNNHINNLTYCKTSKKLKNIDRSCSHLDRSKFTKDLIDFIKKDFSDEKDFGHEEEIINILNRLPLSGSENQDKELIEIAFELCNAEMEEKTDTHLEIEKKDLAINSDLKNSLKEKIKNLDRNKDNFDFFDQFCRTG